jgi:hypothetical protein
MNVYSCCVFIATTINVMKKEKSNSKSKINFDSVLKSKSICANAILAKTIANKEVVYD